VVQAQSHALLAILALAFLAALALAVLLSLTLSALLLLTTLGFLLVFLALALLIALALVLALLFAVLIVGLLVHGESPNRRSHGEIAAWKPGNPHTRERRFSRENFVGAEAAHRLRLL
jgi:predicted membrane protein